MASDDSLREIFADHNRVERALTRLIIHITMRPAEWRPAWMTEDEWQKSREDRLQAAAAAALAERDKPDWILRTLDRLNIPRPSAPSDGAGGRLPAGESPAP